MSDIAMIELKRVSRLEKKYLEEEFPVGAVSYQRSDIPTGTHGEPALEVARIAVDMAPYALAALTAYLLRKHKGETIDEEFEIVRKDGTREKKRLRYRKTETGDQKKSLLGFLASLVGAKLSAH